MKQRKYILIVISLLIVAVLFFAGFNILFSVKKSPDISEYDSTYKNIYEGLRRDVAYSDAAVIAELTFEYKDSCHFKVNEVIYGDVEAGAEITVPIKETAYDKNVTVEVDYVSPSDMNPYKRNPNYNRFENIRWTKDILLCELKEGNNYLLLLDFKDLKTTEKGYLVFLLDENYPFSSPMFRDNQVKNPEIYMPAREYVKLAEECEGHNTKEFTGAARR